MQSLLMGHDVLHNVNSQTPDFYLNIKIKIEKGEAVKPQKYVKGVTPQYGLNEKAKCSLCKDIIESNDLKFHTPEYGIICKHCWSEEMGKIIERYPIHDRS